GKYIALACPSDKCNGHKLIWNDAPPSTDKAMPVHLYEVARRGAYPLSPLNDPIGPDYPRKDPSRVVCYIVCLLGVAAAVALFWYPVSGRWRRFVRTFSGRLGSGFRRRGEPRKKVPSTDTACTTGVSDDPDPDSPTSGARWRPWFFLAAVLVGLSLCVVIGFAHSLEGHEPFELFEGISSWPTTVFWTFATFLSVFEF